MNEEEYSQSESHTATHHSRLQPVYIRAIKNSTPWEQCIFLLLLLIVIATGTVLLFDTQKSYLVTIPQSGGVFFEGVVGAPRNITPARATSQTDKDLASIVYAGLLTRNAEGELIPEIAESYTVSEDGLNYTFILREGLTFHDGAPLTSSDVVFTIKHIQDPTTRSPLLNRWAYIAVQNPDPRTVVFTLPEQSSAFIEECTLGILPEHLWGTLKGDEYAHTELNIRPIGAGPYMIQRVDVDTSGIATQYTLQKFSQYALGEPHLQKILFKIYRNQEAQYAGFIAGEHDGLAGVHGADIGDITEARREEKLETSVYHAPMTRLFAVFLNQNKHRLFTYPEVRKATVNAVAQNRLHIISEVFSGYGTPISSPSVHTLRTKNTVSQEISEETLPIESVLNASGWKKDEASQTYAYTGSTGVTPLSFELSTVNTPDMTKTADALQYVWAQHGIAVQVRVHDPADFTQLVVRPRAYEALLFGLDIGHTNDLYAFWHSSARVDPGLNVAQRTDIETDALLEKIRKTSDTEKQKEYLEQFVRLLEKDNTVAFLYAPHSTYLVTSAVQNISMHPTENISERFDSIHEWSRESQSVWPFFAQ